MEQTYRGKIQDMYNELNQYKLEEYSGKHILYSLPCSTIVALTQAKRIVQWKRNRAAEMSRVMEIRNIVQKERYVEGTIKLAYVPEDGEYLSCYDGNHRRLSLKKTFDFYVLVDIMWNVSEKDVTEAFNIVNKAVSVPAIYLMEDMVDIKGAVVDYVVNFTKKYKKMSSTSENCIRPHFERDSFTKNITECWEVLSIEIEGLTIYELLNSIDCLNDDYVKGKKYFGLPTRVMNKCEKEGLWLFAKEKRIKPDDLHPYCKK